MTMLFMNLGIGELFIIALVYIPLLVLYVFVIVKFFQIAADTRKMKGDLEEIKNILRQNNTSKQ